MYGTVALFIEAFGSPESIVLTNLDTPNATTVNITTLTRALTDGAALIDSYIGRQYLLPMTLIPQVLIPYSLDIARYKLDRIRNREDVRVRYEDSIKWLESVRDGKCSLGIDTIANQPIVFSDGYGSISYGSSQSIDLRGFM